jgi:hypothetical protein
MVGININEWGDFLSDEEVDNSIINHKTNIYKCSGSISQSIISELYNTIVAHASLSNRAKLFYLDHFEDLLIKSRIHTDNEVINYKNSLPK